MDGVHILNQTEIMTYPEVLRSYLIILAIIIVLSLFVLKMADEYDWKTLGLCSFASFLLSSVLMFICFLAFIFTLNSVHTGRYRYEATVDDSVTFNNIMKKYEVVEQRGEIWILEDKEEKIE